MFESDSISPSGSALSESHIRVGTSESPIEKQPNEILMNIFVFVRILEHEPPALDPVLSSFAVNQRWRSLALSMPILWSTITVTMTTNHWNSRALLIELHSKRAEPTPQTWIIRNTDGVDEDSTCACMTLLSKRLPNIQNLVIDSPWLTRSIMMHTSTTQLASLKRLTINTTPGPLVTELLKAPNLEHVYLASIFHGSTQPIPCLRTLYAMMHARSFYETILQRPNLEGLALRVIKEFAEDGSDLAIPPLQLIDRLPPSLPFLTTLSLYWSGCDVAIDRLPDFPALQQVDLSHYPDRRMKDMELEAIGIFFRKLPPTLHSLRYSPNLSSGRKVFKKTRKMFLESTQALTNVRKLVFSGGSLDPGPTFLNFLHMFFASSSFTSVKKLVIYNSNTCDLEALDAFCASDIVKTWFALRTTKEDILDVDIYPTKTEIGTLHILYLALKWDRTRRGKIPFRLNFLFNSSRRTTKIFPYIYELEPHVDAQIPLYS